MKFFIKEYIPSYQIYGYEVEAKSYEEALDLIQNGKIEPNGYEVERDDFQEENYELEEVRET